MSALDDWKERQEEHRRAAREALDRGKPVQVPSPSSVMLHFKCPACRCAVQALASKFQGECRVNAQTDACTAFVQCPFCATFSPICSFPLRFIEKTEAEP